MSAAIGGGDGEKTMAERYANYDDVPWYRKSEIMNVLVLAGFFAFPPLLWTASILCLTGDIYTREVGADGFLEKCPTSTKIAALCALILQSAGVALLIRSNMWIEIVPKL